MRAWIKLFESLTRNLYHGTSMGGLVDIATTNTLGAYGGEDQASFSRNIEVARRFTGSAIGIIKYGNLTQYSAFYQAMANGEITKEGENLSYRAEVASGGGGAVFVCDWDKLAADHKIETVDFGNDGDEEEEAIFRDIHNFDQYLVSIEIDREGFARYCAMIEAEGDDEDRARLVAAKAWVAKYA